MDAVKVLAKKGEMEGWEQHSDRGCHGQPGTSRGGECNGKGDERSGVGCG